MTLSNYWSFQNLFAYRPLLQWPLQWWYVGMLALLLVVLVVSFIIRKKIGQEVASLLINFCLTNLFWGGILYFFRVQRIPLFGMDIWRLLQELSMAIYLGVALPATIRAARINKQEQKQVAAKEKYLPKPKKA